MENLQTRIIGDYLCYRHHQEKRIRFRNLNESEKELKLDLKYLLTDKIALKHVTFDGLKK